MVCGRLRSRCIVPSELILGIRRRARLLLWLAFRWCVQWPLIRPSHKYCGSSLPVLRNGLLSLRSAHPSDFEAERGNCSALWSFSCGRLEMEAFSLQGLLYLENLPNSALACLVSDFIWANPSNWLIFGLLWLEWIASAGGSPKAVVDSALSTISCLWFSSTSRELPCGDWWRSPHYSLGTCKSPGSGVKLKVGWLMRGRILWECIRSQWSTPQRILMISISHCKPVSCSLLLFCELWVWRDLLVHCNPPPVVSLFFSSLPVAQCLLFIGNRCCLPCH